MDALMPTDVLFLRERFTAHVATVILLARVHFHVFLQIVIVRNHFLAHRTLNREILADPMNATQVSLEAFLERKLATANLALEYLLGAEQFLFVIELVVQRQIGLDRKTFVTNLTLVLGHVVVPFEVFLQFLLAQKSFVAYIAPHGVVIFVTLNVGDYGISKFTGGHKTANGTLVTPRMGETVQG